jgi:DNA-binding NarL/FixJ family response regulator
MKMLKLALVDDEILFLNGLKAILENEHDLDVVYTATNGDAFLKQYHSSSSFPDIILLDLKMDGKDGVEIANRIKETKPEQKIIILSSYYKDTFSGYMMQLGVNAFLPKNTPPDELIQVIHKVHKQGLYFSENQFKSLQDQLSSRVKFRTPYYHDKEQISHREKEVLELICQQNTNQEIANKLHISIRTVEGHRNKLLLKTEAKNTVGLVLYAIFHQMIDSDKMISDYGYDF